ncbi:MAG: DUF6036 family nucleotidyltransferase [Candidatus Helarchaeota archaeon]
MAEIENIISRIEKIFSSINLKYVIVGGIAIIHYGHLRTTQDIDIILEDNRVKFPKLLKLFKKNNFSVNVDDFYQSYKEKSHVNIFDEKSYLRLDVKVASKIIDKEVLKTAIQEKIFNHNLYIASLEYVLIGKLLFIGKIDDIADSELLEYQDVLDFLTIYHANNDRINKILLKEKAMEIGLENTLKRLVSFKF